MAHITAELFQMADPKKDKERLEETKEKFEDRKNQLTQALLVLKLYEWVDYLETFYFKNSDKWAPFERLAVLKVIGGEYRSLVYTNNFVESANKVFKYFTMLNQRGKMYKVLLGIKEFTIGKIRKCFKISRGGKSLFTDLTNKENERMIERVKDGSTAEENEECRQ